MKTQSKDFTKQAPVSPYERLAGFAILPRTIDKCRAFLNGVNGEYNYDCPVDNVLFKFKGITGEEFKAVVASGKTNAEIGEWMHSHGTPRTPDEIAKWSDQFKTDFSYATNPKKKDWFIPSCEKLGLDPMKTTLFDYLVADDRASFE